MVEARLAAELQRSTGRQASLDIQLDVLLPGLGPHPYLHLGTVGRIIMDMTGTLWGSAGEALSQGILGLPLGPPAGLAVSLGCLGDVSHSIDEFIHFGSATLIPGNTPGEGQEFDAITPDAAS